MGISGLLLYLGGTIGIFGWVIRASRDKGYPWLGLLSILSCCGFGCLGPILLALIPAAPNSVHIKRLKYKELSGIPIIRVEGGGTVKSAGIHCSTCQALLSPVMTKCPRCGSQRITPQANPSDFVIEPVSPEPTTDIDQTPVETEIASDIDATSESDIELKNTVAVAPKSERLAKLYKLFESGAISEDEFRQLKDLE